MIIQYSVSTKYYDDDYGLHHPHVSDVLLFYPCLHSARRIWLKHLHLSKFPIRRKRSAESPNLSKSAIVQILTNHIQVIISRGGFPGLYILQLIHICTLYNQIDAAIKEYESALSSNMSQSPPCIFLHFSVCTFLLNELMPTCVLVVYSLSVCHLTIFYICLFCFCHFSDLSLLSKQS